MGFNPQDHFFKKAKKEGFLARSAYKLDEIQKKYKVIKPGNSVLDLGCAPGAWLQVALQIVGPKGFVEGIDLKPVVLTAPNGNFFVKDVFRLEDSDLKGFPYDVVMSDMAPNTSGNKFSDQAKSEELCLKVLELSDRLLRPGGNMVMKFFMGGGSKALELEVKKRFVEFNQLRPEATRT
ncbi:MAG: RlmE family RNA methyltransferase, partial [Bdellovibrionota bacterium]